MQLPEGLTSIKLCLLLVLFTRSTHVWASEGSCLNMSCRMHPFCVLIKEKRKKTKAVRTSVWITGENGPGDEDRDRRREQLES